jgi:hypothetical protein
MKSIDEKIREKGKTFAVFELAKRKGPEFVYRICEELGEIPKGYERYYNLGKIDDEIELELIENNLKYKRPERECYHSASKIIECL